MFLGVTHSKSQNSISLNPPKQGERIQSFLKKEEFKALKRREE
jgi:hypothetical protein